MPEHGGRYARRGLPVRASWHRRVGARTTVTAEIS